MSIRQMIRAPLIFLDLHAKHEEWRSKEPKKIFVVENSVNSTQEEIDQKVNVLMDQILQAFPQLGYDPMKFENIPMKFENI